MTYNHAPRTIRLKPPIALYEKRIGVLSFPPICTHLSVNFGARLYVVQFQFPECALQNCCVRFLGVSCFMKIKLNSWFLHDFREN